MKKKQQPQSAFFDPRVFISFLLLFGAVLLVVGAFGISAQGQAPARHETTPQKSTTTTPSTPPESTAADGERLSPADDNGRFVYLIEFAEPGMLKRQANATEGRFTADTPEARSNQAQLMTEQAARGPDINRATGRNLDVTHYFLVTHSGLASRLTPEEAEMVRALQGVKSIERERVYNLDTYRGPTFIGADTIWNGTALPPGGSATRGQGIIIANLDTGIDPGHPSFANDAACGHGVGAAPNKLISSLDCSTATGPGGLCNGPDPTDSNGHGTHTASTSARNTLPSRAGPPPGPRAPNTQISGVAPCANIRAYKVCATNTCAQADIQAGMNSVLIHGDVKVMNFSISGGTSPWSDNDRRKLDLVAAGICVYGSRGHASVTLTNPVGQVNHSGPWVMTVAASTRDGVFTGRLSASGPGSPPANIQNIPLDKGSDSPLGSQ